MAHPSARGLGLTFALLAFAVPALAQDDPRMALLVSFPSPTVSFQWEMSDAFALRVEGSYSYRSTTEESRAGGATEHVYANGATSQVIFADLSGSSAESVTHSGSIGVAGIVTIHRAEHVRLYLAPRVALAMTRQQITATSLWPSLTPPQPGRPAGGAFELEPRTETVTFTSTSPTFGVSFGAVAKLFPRLALFGEAGVNYSESELPGTAVLDEAERQVKAVNTRAVAGIKFLF